jgi:Pyruvate phosphate dikinase, AMP/ATP-binding domain
MVHPCLTLLPLLLLLATPALAQDLDIAGSYRLQTSADVPGELVVEETATGFSIVREADGVTLQGEGQLDASGVLRVRYQSLRGLAGRLILGGAGPQIQARYLVIDDQLHGVLRIEQGGRRYQRAERGERIVVVPDPQPPVVDEPPPADPDPVVDGSLGDPPPADPQPVELTDPYLLAIPDRATFEAMSRRDNVPGAMGVREVKFLVTGVDTPNPVLHFINTRRFSLHYEFATQGLGLSLSLREFNAQTYFTQRRSFLAGSIIAHDSFEHPVSGRGIYTVEFWPTDPVHAPHVGIAFHQVVAGMASAAERIYYHPSGDTQQGIVARDRDEFDRRQIRLIDTQELFSGVTFSALNLGEGYGLLRVMDGADPRPATVRDVVIFKTIPNDLSHVAGVITELPQTPLSHINLKAKQNDTPNAYIRGASDDPQVAALVGKLVHFVVTSDGYTIEEATQAEAEAFLESVRPAGPQFPDRDLSLTDVRPLDELGNADISRVGAKAANLAELRRILPAGMAPDGFAVPFSYYDEFMRFNGFYDEARDMMADPVFQSDPTARERALRDFRRRIRRGDVPADLSARLGEVQRTFPAGQPIRGRSSTNNEDLEGFNGAGLYDSYTHRANEGHLENTVKQVWASLWNYRAFEEREFYRIDHFTAAMGVLLHPNFDDELANGVAVTKNIYDPNWPGFYVNVQVGESLVTNPDPGATPDELLIARLGPRGEYETQFIQRTSLPLPAGQETVLTAAQTRELVRSMERIQEHFQGVYGRQGDPTFAMDIEFKIDEAGRLKIKQARPWVD